MAVSDIFKISRKTFFDPKSWADTRSIVDQNRTIFAVLKAIFTPAKPERQETFEEAMKRQGLTEDQVLPLASTYRLYALIFLACAIVSFAYAFYLLFRYHHLLAFGLSLSVMAFFLAQVFRYDFWSLQLRSRKLGLTFRDWTKSWLGE